MNRIICVVISLGVVFINGFLLDAGGSPKVISSFTKCRLTPENILEASPPVPQDVRLSLKEFIEQHNSLIHQLTSFHLDTKWINSSFEQGKALIQKAQLRDLSSHSYIFELPTNPNYIIKISSAHHRFFNIMYYYGKSHKNLPTDEELSQFPLVKTYQTVSRLAYSILVKQVCAERGIDDIIIPDTYLICFDGKSVASDENCFILQKKVSGNLFPLIDHQDRLQAVASKTFQHLLELVVLTGIWSLKSNLCIDESGRLVLYDFEQPNNENPKYFFHQNQKKKVHNSVAGLVGLTKLFLKSPAHISLIQQAIKEHLDIFNLEEMEEYDRLLIKNILENPACMK